MNRCLPSALLALSISLCTLSTACRNSHDADVGELASLQTLSDSLRRAGDRWNSSDIPGELSGMYALLMALSGAPAGVWAEPDGLLTAGESWPGCMSFTDSLTEGAILETGVTYDDCEYEYEFSGDEGSSSLQLDGSHNWFREGGSVPPAGTVDANLTYDFSNSGAEVSRDWMVHLSMDLEYEYVGPSHLSGRFEVIYAEGVPLGGSPAPGGRIFQLNGTIEDLRWASRSALFGGRTCGPNRGSLDWTSSLQEGTDDPDNRHVTIKWTNCGQATIRM
jgi:hypothetical protein